MKAVCFSDTHRQHHSVKIPDGDVLIFAGDAELRNKVETVEFNEWLGTLPHKHKYVICGNHDFYGERRYAEMCQVMTSCTYLENESVMLPNGMTLWASPWTPRFFDWAFMQTEEGLAEMYKSIPRCEIMVTHGPAKGFLDVGRPKYGHVGSESLAAAIAKVKPRYHIFGHIHGSYGQLQTADTQFVNCSVLDEDYSLENEPIILEL